MNRYLCDKVQIIIPFGFNLFSLKSDINFISDNFPRNRSVWVHPTMVNRLMAQSHKAKKQCCLLINHTRPIRIKNVFKHVAQCQKFIALHGLNSFDRLQSYKTFQQVNSIFSFMVYRPIFRAAWTDTKNAWKQWK